MAAAEEPTREIARSSFLDDLVIIIGRNDIRGICQVAAVPIRDTTKRDTVFLSSVDRCRMSEAKYNARDDVP